MRRPWCAAVVGLLCLAGCASASPQERTDPTRPELTDLLAQLERALFGPDGAPVGVADVVVAMSQYLDAVVGAGVPVRAVTRPMLGLLHAQRGARTWRRLLSDALFLEQHGRNALTVAAAGAAESTSQ